MAIYRNVSMTFWTDSKVSDDFSSDDRYVYLYLFTNPHSNLCGCYEVSYRQMAYETGLDIKKVKAVIRRLQEVHNVIRYDECTKEVLLLNWHKYNWTSSEKFRRPLKAEIDNVKVASFRNYLSTLFDGNEPQHIDTVSDLEDTVSAVDNTEEYPTDTTVSVSVSVTDTDTVSDTVKEIIEFMNETCGTNYRPNTKKTKDLIRARLNENFTVDDFKTVIYKKSKQWKDDPKMCKYLRPETLFGNKFEGYLNEKAAMTFEERLAMA